MRLWHYKLIPELDRQRLLSQHRECCALRGKSWGKKHATVDYVFKHDYMYLYAYHLLVMNEMQRRGYYVEPAWYEPEYHGKEIGRQQVKIIDIRLDLRYPEHDDAYLAFCKNLIKEKEQRKNGAD